MNYNSVTISGHDYSRPLRDMLPDIIGKRSKSAPQVAIAAGRRAQTVQRLLALLHSQGQVHIKRWTRNRAGPYAPCYRWGPGTDAPKPAAQSRSVISKRYRESDHGKPVCDAIKQRWRNSERGKEYAENANKARWAREKFTKGGLAAIDPLLAAIMRGYNAST